MNLKKHFLDYMLDLVLSKWSQERLGLHIVRRARGEGNDDQGGSGSAGYELPTKSATIQAVCD